MSETTAPPPAPRTAPGPGAGAHPGESSYLDFLPAVFQESPDGGPTYLGRLLLAFEDVLTGEGTGTEPSLDAVLDGLHRYFVALDPTGQGQEAPVEFLDWLSRWVAVSLRADIDVPRRRQFIAHAIPLYRLRGTRRGLAEMVRLYAGIEPEIRESSPGLRVGSTTVVGVGMVGGGPPHTFEVLVRLTPESAGALNADRFRLTHEVVSAIIEAEKPAHTVATIRVEAPTLQVGRRSTVGVDTLLSNDRGAHLRPAAPQSGPTA